MLHLFGLLAQPPFHSTNLGKNPPFLCPPTATAADRNRRLRSGLAFNDFFAATWAASNTWMDFAVQSAASES